MRAAGGMGGRTADEGAAEAVDEVAVDLGPDHGSLGCEGPSEPGEPLGVRHLLEVDAVGGLEEHPLFDEEAVTMLGGELGSAMGHCSLLRCVAVALGEGSRHPLPTATTVAVTCDIAARCPHPATPIANFP